MNKKSFFTKPVWLTRNLVGFSLASVMSDANHEIVPLVLPLFLAQLVGKQTAPELVALISSFATMIASLTALYAGKVSDQLVNRKPLIVVGYFLTCTLVGLLAFAQHWITVFFLMAGAWIGRGLVSAPRNALIADSTPKEFYGHAFGFRQALDTLGSISGPLLVFFLAQWPTESLFLFALIPGLAALLIVIFFTQDIPRTITTPDHPFTLWFIFQNSLPKAFYSLLGIFFLFGLGSFNKALLILRMSEVLSPYKSTPQLLGYITLFYMYRNTIQAFASYLLGALSDYRGRIVILAFCGFGAFAVMALLLAYPSPSFLMIALIFTLSGMSAGTYMTIQKSLAADLLPESIRGTGYGMLKTVDSIGNLASSITIGLIWSNIGPQPAFILAALISIICVGILLSWRARFIR